MSVFDIIVADPCWSFSDTLTMDKVKRGAAANYELLNNEVIKNLNVKELAADNSILALWVPSSLLDVGFETMESWGFRLTQTWIWNKIKKDPFEKIKKIARKKATKRLISVDDLDKILDSADFNDMLAFGMGRLFRQCHEVVLVGVKGKPYANLKNKSQRSVSFDINFKHSKKPETLQDRLEKMFPSSKKLELFARRDRADWTCVGLECPSSAGEDIRDSIERLKKL